MVCEVLATTMPVAGATAAGREFATVVAAAFTVVEVAPADKVELVGAVMTASGSERVGVSFVVVVVTGAVALFTVAASTLR